MRSEAKSRILPTCPTRHLVIKIQAFTDCEMAATISRPAKRTEAFLTIYRILNCFSSCNENIWLLL